MVPVCVPRLRQLWTFERDHQLRVLWIWENSNGFFLLPAGFFRLRHFPETLLLLKNFPVSQALNHRMSFNFLTDLGSVCYPQF